MSETTEKAKHFIVQNDTYDFAEPVSEYGGPSLYKYIGINATTKNFENDFFVESANLKKDLRNFDSIKDKKAWFSKYVLLNDPFEMSACYYVPKNTADEQAFDLRNTMNRYVTGVLSLAEEPDNLLMWSHYANNHNGYCLQFEVLNPFSFFKVSYREQKENCINDAFFLADKQADYLKICKNLATKSKHWEYEKEYRAFLCQTDTSDTGSGVLESYENIGLVLDKIIIGANCDPAMKKAITSLCMQLKIHCAVACIPNSPNFTVSFVDLF